jgi:hypothetical protein
MWVIVGNPVRTTTIYERSRLVHTRAGDVGDCG